MSTAELKVQIFRKIDTLEDAYLDKIHKYITDILVERETKEWDNLSDVQKAGLIDAIEESEKGKVLPNNSVISKYKKTYSDA